VELVSAGLDGVVGDSSAAEGCGSGAGLHGELIDRIDRNGMRHGIAAALLGDVGYGHAFDVVLVEVGLASAAVDARISTRRT
jgi:hypothetical protein